MSFTVPRSTNSGMERHRLPPVHPGPGPKLPTARIGLTKGSLRPLARIILVGGFFSGAEVVAVLARVAEGGGVLTTITGFFVLVVVLVETATFFPAGLVAGTALEVLLPAGTTVACAVEPPLVFEGKVPVATDGLGETTAPPLLEVAPLVELGAGDGDFAAVAGPA